MFTIADHTTKAIAPAGARMEFGVWKT